MSQLFYLISESFSGWKEHRMVVFPALVTIFLCSVLLCVALFTLRASNRILQTEGSFYTIDVFLKDSVPQEEIKLIEKKLKLKISFLILYIISRKHGKHRGDGFLCLLGFFADFLLLQFQEQDHSVLLLLYNCLL